ncbi:MAG: hypothetical protein RKE49_16185 [Oceanicaulis sp.]
MALRFTTLGALALFLAACGETGTNDASPYAAGDSDAAQVNAGEAGAEDGETPDEPEGPSTLDQAARTACEAGDDGFADTLPDGAAFASRGPDARVHVGWKRGGDAIERIVYAPGLERQTRTAFDGAVADFLRRNMAAADDRTGRTGAFRGRDGRFCIVQTEAEAVDALIEAVNALPDQAGE